MAELLKAYTADELIERGPPQLFTTTAGRLETKAGRLV